MGIHDATRRFSWMCHLRGSTRFPGLRPAFIPLAAALLAFGLLASTCITAPSAQPNSGSTGSAKVYRLLPEAGEVTFEVGLLFTDISGDFRDYYGTVVMHDGVLESVEAEIRCRSVDLPDRERERKVRSGEFLACGEHPLIRFESSAITPGESARYRVTGDLTLVGTTRSITLTGQLEPTETPDRYRFRASAEVRWEKWGIKAMQEASANSLVVDDLLHLSIQGILIPRQSQ